MTQRLLLQIEKSELKDLMAFFFISQHNSNYLSSFPCPQYMLRRHKEKYYPSVCDQLLLQRMGFDSCIFVVQMTEVVNYFQCNTKACRVAF